MEICIFGCRSECRRRLNLCRSCFCPHKKKTKKTQFLKHWISIDIYYVQPAANTSSGRRQTEAVTGVGVLWGWLRVLLFIFILWQFCVHCLEIVVSVHAMMAVCAIGRQGEWCWNVMTHTGPSSWVWQGSSSCFLRCSPVLRSLLCGGGGVERE